MFETPLTRSADVDAEGRLDEAQITQLALVSDAHALQIVGLELAAIGDGQLDLCRLAGIDHLPALLDRDLHGLLTQHVFARGSRLESLFGMLRVRCHDVDRVDVPIVGHALHRVVGVAVGRGDPELHLPRARLIEALGDDSRQAAVLGLLQRRRDLMLAEIAEPAYGETDLACRFVFRSADEWHRGRRQYELTP